MAMHATCDSEKTSTRLHGRRENVYSQRNIPAKLGPPEKNIDGPPSIDGGLSSAQRLKCPRDSTWRALHGKLVSLQQVRNGTPTDHLHQLGSRNHSGARQGVHIGQVL